MITTERIIRHQQSQWFREWFNSPHYHKVYRKRNEKEAADFINELIQYLQPENGASMVDIGCGSGRHSIQLASMGFAVTGFDLASASIREAKQKTTENLRFLRHDMRQPFGEKKFGYAFNLFTSFGYFMDEEHDKIINNISASLKAGGTLVFDYLNAAYAEKNLVPSEATEIDGVIYTISRWTDKTHFYKKISITGKGIEEIDYTEKVAKLSREKMEIFFMNNGLILKESFGDYTLNTYDSMTSPRMILIAEKIK